MSNTKTSTINPVKLIGFVIIVASALMFAAGGATWIMVTSQLKAENITVSKVTDAEPGSLAGKPVAGPFTAYAQADAINHHALEAAGGKTYAELGAQGTALKAKLAAGGMSKADIAKDKGVIAIADTRTSTMNGSFLRASLFTSVISFGVAALVMGLGVLFALLGFALIKITNVPVVRTAPVKGKVAVPAGAKA
jgi:hypothetical protein